MDCSFDLSGKKILVTGANGFIGARLVRHLLQYGASVVGTGSSPQSSGTLEKRHSRHQGPFEYQPCDLVEGRVSDLAPIMQDCELVFHLAAATRLPRNSQLPRVNTTMTRLVLDACADRSNPPTVIAVSSMAAMGRSQSNQKTVETDRPKPLSFYGKSKFQSEQIALKMGAQLPISIVRPPVVLGQGDVTGLKMFHFIDRWKRHPVGGYRNDLFSVIHVDDLVHAMISVAVNGKRTTSPDSSEGIYFAAEDEVFSYADLGKVIGKALGLESVPIHRVPIGLMRIVGRANDLFGMLTSTAPFLSSDKLRDAMAGSWICSPEKIKKETGFRTAVSFLERLKQTVHWYRQEGWLPSRKPDSASSRDDRTQNRQELAGH